jgi:hypothetical protein
LTSVHTWKVKKVIVVAQNLADHLSGLLEVKSSKAVTKESTKVKVVMHEHCKKQSGKSDLQKGWLSSARIFQSRQSLPRGRCIDVRSQQLCYLCDLQVGTGLEFTIIYHNLI